jgi:hypothetical protein
MKPSPGGSSEYDHTGAMDGTSMDATDTDTDHGNGNDAGASGYGAAGGVDASMYVLPGSADTSASLQSAAGADGPYSYPHQGPASAAAGAYEHSHSYPGSVAGSGTRRGPGPVGASASASASAGGPPHSVAQLSHRLAALESALEHEHEHSLHVLDSLLATKHRGAGAGGQGHQHYQQGHQGGIYQYHPGQPPPHAGWSASAPTTPRRPGPGPGPGGGGGGGGGHTFGYAARTPMGPERTQTQTHMQTHTRGYRSGTPSPSLLAALLVGPAGQASIPHHLHVPSYSSS